MPRGRWRRSLTRPYGTASARGGREVESRVCGRYHRRESPFETVRQAGGSRSFHLAERGGLDHQAQRSSRGHRTPSALVLRVLRPVTLRNQRVIDEDDARHPSRASIVAARWSRSDRGFAGAAAGSLRWKVESEDGRGGQTDGSATGFLLGLGGLGRGRGCSRGVHPRRPDSNARAARPAECGMTRSVTPGAGVGVEVWMPLRFPTAATWKPEGGTAATGSLRTSRGAGRRAGRTSSHHLRAHGVSRPRGRRFSHIARGAEKTVAMTWLRW